MPRLLSALLMLTLAWPAFAQQEKLIGTWEYLPAPEDQEAGMVLRLEFKAGGQFEVTGQSALSGEQLFQESDQDQAAGAGKLLRPLAPAQADESTAIPGLQDVELDGEALAEILAVIFPDTLTVTVKVTGTWEADAERLRLDGQASQMFVNGLEPRAFFDQLARSLAGELAKALELPAEEYPEFEAEIVSGFSEGAEENLDEGFSPDDVDAEGTYVIQDGMLAVTDSEGEVTRFQQVLVSAVEALTWGQLKAAGP